MKSLLPDNLKSTFKIKKYESSWRMAIKNNRPLSSVPPTKNKNKDFRILTFQYADTNKVTIESDSE